METNEFLIRVSGKVAIEPKELELGQDLEIVLSGTIIDIHHKDTQDGMMDKVYIIKPTTAVLKQ